MANPTKGLLWKGNDRTGSHNGIVFSGTALPNFVGHTFIWKQKYYHQMAYYGNNWWVPDKEAAYSGTYAGVHHNVGMHPYPDYFGNNNFGLASSPSYYNGVRQFFEVAGGSGDFIGDGQPPTNPSQPVFSVEKGKWYTHAQVIEYVTVTTSNDTIRITFYIDVENDITKKIVYDFLTVDLDSASDLAFAIGPSPWSFSSTANSETPGGIQAQYQMYNAALSASDIQLEAVTWRSSSTGNTNYWYLRSQPSTSDVSDESGAGHNPSWRTTDYPDDWNGEYFPMPIYASDLATSSSGTTRTPDISGCNLQTGDIIFAHVVLRFTNCDAATITPPSGEGWTLVTSSRVSSTTVLSGALYWKRWGSGSTDDSTPTWTVSTGGLWGVTLTVHRDCVDSGTPWNAAAAQANASSSTMTAPTATPVGSGNNNTVLRFFASSDDNSHASPSSGHLIYGRDDFQDASGSGYSCSASCLPNRTGTTAVGTATMSQTANGSDISLGWTVILSPAAAATTTRGTPFGHRGTAFNGGRTFHGIIQ